jgi:hypothetical protein
MAKTAVSQLQEQIEAIRREAFAAGFAAAMQSVRRFISTQTPDAEPQSVEVIGRRSAPHMHGTALRRRAGSNASEPRRGATVAPKLERGRNARLVEEVLQSNAPRALRPAEIRTTIQREKGVVIAFTSIRHALGQLEARRIAEQVADSNTWRYREGGGNRVDGIGDGTVTAAVE